LGSGHPGGAALLEEPAVVLAAKGAEEGRTTDRITGKEGSGRRRLRKPADLNLRARPGEK
jgi:hypothetical protein